MNPKDKTIAAKTIRVDQEVVDMLQLLKDPGVPYHRIIKELVHEELKKTHAHTRDGYLPIGTVVEDTEGNVLVIKAVIDGKVVFNDMTGSLNGGGVVWRLRKLADTVEQYEGGFTVVSIKA